MRYLYERYHPVYHCQPSEIPAAIGAILMTHGGLAIEKHLLERRLKGTA